MLLNAGSKSDTQFLSCEIARAEPESLSTPLLASRDAPSRNLTTGTFDQFVKELIRFSALGGPVFSVQQNASAPLQNLSDSLILALSLARSISQLKNYRGDRDRLPYRLAALKLRGRSDFAY